jgi:hypothetical protein
MKTNQISNKLDTCRLNNFFICNKLLDRSLEIEKTAHKLLHKPLILPLRIDPTVGQAIFPELFGRNICIVLQKFSSNDGRGDESFAEKTYTTLNDATPFAVSLHPIRDFEEMHMRAFRPHLPLEPMNRVALKASKFPTLVIHGPSLEGNTKDGVPVAEIPSEIYEKGEVWHIEEYSPSDTLKWSRSRSLQGKIIETGLSSKEWGIYCDKDLYEKSKRIEKTGHECDRKELGSIELLPLRSLLTTDPTNHLYLCYVKKVPSQGNFAHFVLLLEQQNQNNIDICFLGENGKPSDGFLDQFSTLYKEYADKHMPRYGLKEVELITWNDKKGLFETVYSYESKSSTRTKKIRFIFCGPIVQSDYFRLLLGSEFLTAATGDQSLSEALMCRKSVYYDCFQYKRPLYDQLRKLCEQLGHHEASVLYGVNEFKTAEFLSKPTSQKLLRACSIDLAKYIYENKNLGARIQREVNHWNRKIIRLAIEAKARPSP